LETPPSSSLNADEGVAKGCCLQSVAISDKFLTKSFQIEEAVTNDDVKTAYFDEPKLGLGQDKLTQFVKFEVKIIEDNNKGHETLFWRMVA
jgi:hypothetical protein